MYVFALAVVGSFKAQIFRLIDLRNRQADFARHDDVGVRIVSDVMDHTWCSSEVRQHVSKETSCLLGRFGIDRHVNSIKIFQQADLIEYYLDFCPIKVHIRYCDDFFATLFQSFKKIVGALDCK
ncbi:hypothetical protein ASF36_24760 [Methylobacterium sp. Leaf90]|nr:hypothetical protein ASF36_24760 [Methylobacterium sp. Leaf90]